MKRKLKSLFIAIGVSAAFMVAYLLFQVAAGVAFTFSYSMLLGAGIIPTETVLDAATFQETVTRAYMNNIALIMVVSGLVFIVLSLVIILGFHKKQKWNLGNMFEIRRRAKKGIPIGIFCFLCGFLINISMSNLISLIPMPEQWTEANNESVEAILNGNLIAAYLATFVIAPVAEELIFRGVAYNLLRDAIPLKRRASMIISCIIVSAIFGIYHGNILQGIYTFLFSIVLVVIYELTGSIWCSIVTHAGFNSILLQALVSRWVYVEGIELFNGLIYLFIGSLMIFLVFLFTKDGKQHAAYADDSGADGTDGDNGC